MVKVDEDVEVCGSDDRPSEELLVNSNGGVKNAVLSIEGIASGKQWGNTGDFVYDQRECKFVPRMLLIRPKAQGVVLNSDAVGHNFHTISKGIFNVNKKIKAGAKMKVAKNKLRRPGIIRAKCDMHSWMKGWWIVAGSPYTVISDENGNYSIVDIPPGTYVLKLWHEVLGESEQTVVVKANGSTEINVTLEL
jgi:plastocyanin